MIAIKNSFIATIFLVIFLCACTSKAVVHKEEMKASPLSFEVFQIEKEVLANNISGKAVLMVKSKNKFIDISAGTPINVGDLMYMDKNTKIEIEMPENKRILIQADDKTRSFMFVSVKQQELK